jgi:hypothetical protein
MDDLLVMFNLLNQNTPVKANFPNGTDYASLVLIYPFLGLLVEWTLLTDERIWYVEILIADLKRY